MSATTPTPRTFPCPVCNKPVPVGAQICPNSNCKEDLSGLAIVDTLGANLYDTALEQIRAGKPSEAIRVLESATEINPDHVDARVTLGNLYAQTGKRNEAISQWERVLALQPDEPRAQARIRQTRRELARGVNTRRLIALGAIALSLVIGLFAGAAVLRPTPVPTPIQAADTQAIPIPTPVPSLNQTTVTQTSPMPTPDLVTGTRNALKANPRTAALGLEVDQRGEVIILRGAAPDAETKQVAETAVQSVPGVTAVDSTAIRIQLPPIADAVRAEFGKYPAMAIIQVSQEGNTIRLSGLVTTTEIKKQAEEIARRTVGVARVDARDLTVDLATAVTNALRSNPETTALSLTVEQSESGVRVRGIADAALVSSVIRIAQSVPGVVLVDTSKLEIRKAINLERVKAYSLTTPNLPDDNRSVWGVVSSAVWTRDGKRILVASNMWWVKDFRTSPSPITIYSVSSRLHLIFEDSWQSATIIEKFYDADTSGDRGIFRRPLFAIADAIWSPNGDRIAVSFVDEIGNRCPYIANANGTEFRKLPNCEADDLPRYWSENGEWLITWSERESRLYAYSVAGSRRVPLETLGKIPLWDQRYYPWRVTYAPMCKSGDFWSCK